MKRRVGHKGYIIVARFIRVEGRFLCGVLHRRTRWEWSERKRTSTCPTPSRRGSPLLRQQFRLDDRRSIWVSSGDRQSSTGESQASKDALTLVFQPTAQPTIFGSTSSFQRLWR